MVSKQYCLAVITLLLAGAAPFVDGHYNDNQEDTNKVKLGVFYESRCPDSKRFFLNQLVPTYKELGQIMELELVPFGHARVLSKDQMVCQHGARECEGNRLMACVEARGKSIDMGQVVKTIGCLFENRQQPKDCVSKHLPEVDFADLERCKSGEESYKMMVEFEKLTGKVDYIPDLRLDGEKSSDIQQEAEHELKNFVCSHYNGTQPEACRGSQPSSH